ncbi:NUDIX hydrolase domain-like protein [Elsinoe ampelina]|uniref:NUDIX hydrolase domain-like protein n=1 Tax=Elsinoe ampelina TaxID=302913 RepID=A0A6A6G674_9PEZI|nr:NUDIX hydrolase domain-like protein [Elsinoe ampelina]
MAYLSPTSAAALARLRAFVPPPTNYHSLPITRRAAVLILLFADRSGGLRVVLTIRSTKLRNYAGQAALPGGKADSLEESPWQTARREAWEEIGLPIGEGEIMKGWKVERLGELPCNLAVTELGVRPCVGYLSPSVPSAGDATNASRKSNDSPDPVKDLLPTLDAKEVAAVFTAPFHNFLRKEDEDPKVRRKVPGKWYNGTWVSWHEEAWRMHQFFVPKGLVFRSEEEQTGDEDNPAIGDTNASVSGAANGNVDGSQSRQGKGPSLRNKVVEEARTKEKEAAPAVDPLDEARYKVFGMTARILVDAARVAYGEEPDYEHNSHFGDEDMITRLMKMGRLAPIKKEGERLTRDVMSAAAKM